MSFDKYLKKPKVSKVVDPGVGDAPQAISRTPLIPPGQEQNRDISSTPISTTIKDLIDTSVTLQTDISNIINEVDQVNNSDKGFVLYHEMIKQNHFNPSALITDPSARPTISFQPNEIKAAQRDGYRRINDPRAPFLQDLYDHLADAGLSQYVLTNYWKSLAEPNNLYSEYDQSNTIAKYTLARETQYLEYLRDSSQRIHQNKLTALSESFLRVFAAKIISHVRVDPREQIRTIDHLISLLNQIKAVLVVTSIIHGEKWEQFYSNIKDIYGDFLQLTAIKVAKMAAYPFITGLQDKILDFTEGFADFLPLDIELTDIPEAREFVYQIENCLGNFLAQIEEDLVYREGLRLKLEENRQVLILNSRKNSKTKQFVILIDSTTAFLNELKNTLADINFYLGNGIERLTANFISSIDTHSKTVAIG